MAKGGRPGGGFGGGRGGSFGGGGKGPSFKPTPKWQNSGNSYRNSSGFNLGKAFFLGALLSRGSNNNSNTVGNSNEVFTFSEKPKTEEKTVYICDYCGSVFENETEKCSNCGAHVTAKKNTSKPQNAAAVTQPAKQVAKKKETIKFIALALVIVIVFAALILLINSAKPIEVDVGEWAETEWFNFRVYSTESVKSYEGRTADDGYLFLLIGLSVLNTTEESLDFYDNDFILVKNNQEYYAELNPPANGMMLLFYSYNAEFDYYFFTLHKGQAQTGLLMFQVPQGNYATYLEYTEYDTSRNKGKTFKVVIN